MSQDALSMLKQVKHLDDTRVLFSLLEVLDYENLIQVNQAEIARDLGMQRQNVQRSIKRLMELGVILRASKSASVVHTGSIKLRLERLRQRP